MYFCECSPKIGAKSPFFSLAIGFCHFLVGNTPKQKNFACLRLAKFHGNVILCTSGRGYNMCNQVWRISCHLTRHRKYATCYKGRERLNASVKRTPKNLDLWHTSVSDDSFSEKWCNRWVTKRQCDIILKIPKSPEVPTLGKAPSSLKLRCRRCFAL